ncbi:MAG: NAD(P)-binding domain-containing protein [Bifidobacterium sp.]
MNIAVLGTGMVGRALANRLAELGHHVAIGTRNVDATLSHTAKGSMGLEPFKDWIEAQDNVRLATYKKAAVSSDLIVNAVAGMHSISALESIGARDLAGKVLLDLAIPLDLSNGIPPTLVISNDDSLGEQIQRAFPKTRVVKALHTVYYQVMIHPELVPGNHTIFMGGNDAEAKQVVRSVIASFGWPDESIIDLGDITTARATEMYSRLFFALYGKFGTFNFNINVTRATK